MHILSLHYPLPNAAIDNKDIFNAPSLFEYDVIIFHPWGFEQSILNLLKGEEEFYTASGEKVIQEPSGNNARNINEILEQRRNEIDKFLKMDGILITYAVPEMIISSVEEEPVPAKKNIFLKIFSNIFSQSSVKNEPNSSDEIFSTSRYSLFKLDAGIAFADMIVPGSGFNSMTEDDYHYPNKNMFQDILRNHASKIAYQAYFNQEIISHISSFSPLLATVKSESLIAGLIELPKGTIVFLPNFNQTNTDEAMTEARLLVSDIELFMKK